MTRHWTGASVAEHIDLLSGDERTDAYARIVDDLLAEVEQLRPKPAPIPDEPGPGVYQIGREQIARHIDWPASLWLVAGHAERLTFGRVWELYGGPGVTIQRLVPESTPLAVDEANAVLDRLQETGTRILADMKQGRADAEVAEWNSRWKVGVKVKHWPARDTDGTLRGFPRVTRTHSEAYVLGGHTAVVLLRDVSGPVALALLRVVDEHAAQEPKVAEPGGAS